MENTSIYVPLQSGQLRLITITSIEPTIECRLETRHLSDIAGEYHALSYTWGELVFTATIICNGQPVKITNSLYHGLKQLFQHGNRTEYGVSAWPLWIDAICLNQEDSDEMEVQLPFMAEIYSNTKKTLIYIGHEENQSDLAMTSIPRIHDKLVKVHGPVLFRSNLAEYGIEEEGSPLWLAIAHLIRRPWFSRLWTFQEAVLGNDLVLGCGGEWIEWKLLAGFVELMWSHKLAAMFSLEDTLAFRQRLNNLLFFDSLHSRFDRSAGLPVTDLLHVATTKSCQEPVDRLWGMLGLMQPDLRTEIQERQLIDYTPEGRRDFWRSYLRFAKWLIPHDSRLEILSMAGSLHKLPQLPSWCPNWNSPSGCNIFYNVDFYRAGSNLDACAKVLADTNKLQVRGFRIDTVDKLMDETPNLRDFFTGNTEASELEADRPSIWESECLRLSQQVYGATFGEIPEAHWRTLIADTVLVRQTIAQCSTNFEATYRKWTQELKIGRVKKKHTTLSEKDFLLVDHFSQQVETACVGRKFFSTTGGRVGLAPPGAQERDTVCVLYSGGPLYILRFLTEGEGAEAVLVGNAYVHGMMADGEALSLPDKGMDETFVLV